MTQELSDHAGDVWHKFEKELQLRVKMPSVEVVRSYPFSDKEIARRILNKYSEVGLGKPEVLGAQTHQYYKELGLTFSGLVGDEWVVGPIFIHGSTPNGLIKPLLKHQFAHAIPQILQPSYGYAMGVMHIVGIGQGRQSMKSVYPLIEEFVAFSGSGLGHAEDELLEVSKFESTYEAKENKWLLDQLRNIKRDAKAMKNPFDFLVENNPLSNPELLNRIAADIIVSPKAIEDVMRKLYKMHDEGESLRLKVKVI